MFPSLTTARKKFPLPTLIALLLASNIAMARAIRILCHWFRMKINCQIPRPVERNIDLETYGDSTAKSTVNSSVLHYISFDIVVSHCFRSKISYRIGIITSPSKVRIVDYFSLTVALSTEANIYVS